MTQTRAAIVTVLALLLAVLLALPVWALDASDAGTFVAVDAEGAPVGKVLRVSRAAGRWKFEDRQPDGSWLDVSCHGGCEHKPATAADIVRIFGSPPPPHLRPDCIFNEEYAFCRVHAVEGDVEDRYALIVKIEDGWLPVKLERLPEDAPAPEAPLPPALESARWS